MTERPRSGDGAVNSASPPGKADSPQQPNGEPSGQAEEPVVIDGNSSFSNRGLETNNVWWSSTSIPGFYGTDYRVAPSGASTDPAIFWFDLEETRCFNVDAWWTAASNRSASLTWTAQDQHGNSLGSATVNQQTQGSMWNPLGSWTFPPGRNQIILSRLSGSPGYVVADAVRLSPCYGAPPAPSPPNNQVNLNVPYFYQYDNQYEGWATCGLTSVAMAINWWYPQLLTPDSLYLTYGKAKGQSPSTIASIYGSEGLEAQWTTVGTRAQIRTHLKQGRPVVVHGFWTGSGHIVIIVGFDDKAWIVNDPAGDWETCYGCGPADHVRYAIGGSWDQKMSNDGDIWFSVSSPDNF